MMVFVLIVGAWRSQLMGRRDSHAAWCSGLEQGELFSAIGCRLPIQTAPTLQERILAYSSRLDGNLRLFVVSDNHDRVYFSDCQLTLPLEHAHQADIVHIVPPLRRAFLDYGVYDVLHDVPKAARAARRLEDEGVRVLGQLVQMSAEEVRRYPFIDDGAFAAIEGKLATIDLRFGMRQPDWNRRMRRLLAINL